MSTTSSQDTPAAPAVPSMVAHKLVCKRCGRDCDPWPLERGRRCSPSHWVMCIAPLEMCRVVEVGR